MSTTARGSLCTTTSPSALRQIPRVAAGLKRMLLQAFFTAYYPYARLLTWLMPALTLQGKQLRIPPAVYKPLENEHRYRDFVRSGETVCDLGSGSGVVSAFVAEKAARVVALDVSPEAVAATLANCERLGLGNVEVHQSDMFAATDEHFDVICANPPFVEIPMRGANNQWATSVTLLNRLFCEGRDRLHPGGSIVVLYPRRKSARLQGFAQEAGFALVESQPVGPKSIKLWLLCTLYMQLFFDAHFFVFRRSDEIAQG